MLDVPRIERITRDKDQIVEQFDAGDWRMLAIYLGDLGACITEHPRLLRSLRFEDDDYSSCVADVLGNLVSSDDQALDLVERMLREKKTRGNGAKGTDGTDTLFFGTGHAMQSAVPIDTSLVTAMMPFHPEFDDVRVVISNACVNVGCELKAADDIWKSSVIMQDVINLIARSCMVIVDFTGKNPNVFYETGIAHALGKEVIPITQSLNDVPFDLRHHRVLLYDNNSVGRVSLQQKLEDRMKTIAQKHGWSVVPF